MTLDELNDSDSTEIVRVLNNPDIVGIITGVTFIVSSKNDPLCTIRYDKDGRAANYTTMLSNVVFVKDKGTN